MGATGNLQLERTAIGSFFGGSRGQLHVAYYPSALLYFPASRG